MTNTPSHAATCTCGQVTFEAAGAPIVSAACYCDSCRTAARQFEQAPGAPAVLNAQGGVDYTLFRKDRVALTRGKDRLAEHRLTAKSPTRRMVATCCNTPMVLDFTSGHWLTFYRDRLGDGAPAIEAAMMTKDRPAAAPPLPAGVPASAAMPPRVLFRLLTAWAAMGFRRPKPAW